MAFEPKILLTINLEGGILRKGEPEIKKFYLTKKDLFPNQKFKGEEGNKVIKSGKYKSYPLLQSTATLKIRICREAYEYFISKYECPAWFFKGNKKNLAKWQRLSDTERLELHLQRTCEHHRGKSFTYTIIED